MSFVRGNGAFWLTAVETRPHTQGPRSRPAALVVSSAGTGS